MEKGDVNNKKNMKNLHPKCAKLQKEGDEESWISGEELQTDGSSDEEQTAKLKNQLQQSSNISDNIKTKEKTLKERNLKRQESVAKFNRLKMRSLSCVGDNKDNNNNNNKQSSDSLTESLNLENRWRPKRGSLKLPSLKDDVTKISCSYTGNDEKTCENFTKFIDQHNRQMHDIQESIRKLEIAIDENWKLFQIENDERKKIHRQLQELETTPILISIKNQDVNTEISSDHEEKLQNKSSKSCKLIARRNVELAGETSNFPLTDDEKNQLDQLLSKLDSVDVDESNAYEISDKDREKILRIDEELKKSSSNI